MRRAIVGVAILLSFPLSAQVEKHAPTVDVCRADVALWDDSALQVDYAKAETESVKNNVPSQNEIHKLPIKQIWGRLLEMGDCAKVDPERKASYLDAANFYSSVQGDRAVHFILRHGLIVQFEQEDAAGKR